jgi:hypothetical protein
MQIQLSSLPYSVTNVVASRSCARLAFMDDGLVMRIFLRAVGNLVIITRAALGQLDIRGNDMPEVRTQVVGTTVILLLVVATRQEFHKPSSAVLSRPYSMKIETMFRYVKCTPLFCKLSLRSQQLSSERFKRR